MAALDRATFAEMWRAAVRTRPEGAFLVWEDELGHVTEWTYGAFDQFVDRTAAYLVTRGAQPGDRLHLALANSPAFIVMWLAGIRLGVTVVPSDPSATARELSEHIERTSPVIGVCARSRADVYRTVAAASTVEIIEVAEDDTELEDLTGPTPNDAYVPAPRDPAAVLFTSGTTSRPKGVVITQANYAFAGATMASAAGVNSSSRLLVVLPMFHANAQYYSFAAAIAAGATVALMPSFSASRFLEQAARHRASHASLFAAPMRMILLRGSSPVEDVELRHVWYAQNVADEQYEHLSKLFGCRPRQLYGMTETIPAVLTSPESGARLGSMGRPTPGCSVELHDPESGATVEDGTIGEIVVGGVPGAALFAGYLDDPETTKAAFRDGWFRTGDLAVRDAEGNYDFAGRRGDVLKVSGENVSTIEVESVIASHPSVLEAAVVGRPDPVRDEVPVAYVVLSTPDGSSEIEALTRFCEERLAPSKRPREFVIVPELPHTSVGKVRKFLLAPAGVSGATQGIDR